MPTTGCTCEAPSYLCADGELCIPFALFCDGDADCNGGDDEPDGCDNAGQCPDGEYLCDVTAPPTCMDISTICDGNDDCTGVDEVNCPTPCDCDPGSYRCLNEDLCIPIASYCDGTADCEWGDDEPDAECECIDPGEDSATGCWETHNNGAIVRDKVLHSNDEDKIVGFIEDVSDYDECVSHCELVDACVMIFTYIEDGVMYCFLLNEDDLTQYFYPYNYSTDDDDCEVLTYPVTCPP